MADLRETLADRHVCCLCERRFCLRGAHPRELPLEADLFSGSALIAPVCPECDLERRDEIEDQIRDYESWLRGDSA